jgi:hypothetical protein
MNLIRGTTPIFELPLDFDPTLIEVLFITFVQNGKIVFEKSLAECEVMSESIEVKLSQEDTLRFKAGSILTVQARAKLKDGTAMASDRMNVDVHIVDKDGVI